VTSWLIRRDQRGRGSERMTASLNRLADKVAIVTGAAQANGGSTMW
jgi:hypothetical protein